MSLCFTRVAPLALATAAIRPDLPEQVTHP
jgi:hypothetical protein